MSSPARRGVALPAGETGSSLFQRILLEAVERWPHVLAPAGVASDAQLFRSGYAEALVRFESARLASSARREIARFLVERSRAAFSWIDDAGERPLGAALTEPVAPIALETLPLSGKGALAPRVPYRGRVFAGAELRELGARLVGDARASEPVAHALDWLVSNALDEAGEIDLRGRRFAVVGAGAEIAPTPLLLEAGAEVLWLDTARPPEALAKDSSLSGRLQVPVRPADLLDGTRDVAATLRAFCDADPRVPVDVGLYAYAPGQGREWRLTEAMNAIVDSLPGEALRSVSLLVSPTTPVPLRKETLAAADRRHAERPLWQRGLELAGLLTAAHVGEGDARLLRNVVSVQGPGYQAAQYVGKTLAMERWVTSGPTARRAPVAVSVNVAAITMTRSLRHPVFEAGFAGASAFGVETLEPETTRALNGLLMIHDLLDPAAPGALPGVLPGALPREAKDDDARLRELLRQQIHGGVFALPYALEPAIRIGALIGLARRPSLAPGFVRSLLGG